MSNKNSKLRPAVSRQAVAELLLDLLYAVIAGIIVGTAYFFFQNSNGFAPGGVGGLATITHYLLSDKVSWSLLMVAFNLPIFVLLAIFVNRQLGEMMRILKKYPDTFASFEKVNEVFGNFKRKV